MSTPSLYREYFTAEERKMLDATPRDDLTSEINLLRVMVARVLEASQKARALALKQHAALLAALSTAGTVIARLEKMQLKLHDLTAALLPRFKRAWQNDLQRRLHHMSDYVQY